MRILTSIVVLALAGALLGSPAEAAGKGKKVPRVDSDPPMTVVIVRSSVPGCEPLCPQWISADGLITGKTPALFKKILGQAGTAPLPVVISSPGGEVDAALAIGNMIRARHLDVAVGWTLFSGCAPQGKDCALTKEQKGVFRGIATTRRAFCFSACSFILAAGEKRLLGTGAYAGVHQISTTMIEERVHYWEKYRLVNGKKKVVSRTIMGRDRIRSYTTTKLGKAVRKKLVAYFASMGVDPRLLELFDKAPPSSIHVVAQQEAISSGFVTDFVDASTLVEISVCKVVPPAANCVAGVDSSGAAAGDQPR